MRRRALLAALAAAGTATAGCLDTTGTGPTDTTTSGTTSGATDTTGRTTRTTSAAVETCEPATPTFDLAESPPEDAEYRVSDVEVSTSYERPETRFVLEPDAFYSADAVERAREDSDEEIVVVPIEDVEDTAVREAVRTAIADGEWRADELPEGLRETVERVDFVTGVSQDDTYTHVGVALHEYEVDAPPAVSFDAAVADSYVSPGDPGALAFWLSNRREREWSVFSGTVPPFGMVHAEPGGDATNAERDKFLLWRDYEGEGCFSRYEDGWMRCDIGKNTPIPPCDSVVREYAVLPSTTDHYPDETVPASAGTYEVSDTIGYSQGRGRSVTLSFTVTFELEAV